MQIIKIISIFFMIGAAVSLLVLFLTDWNDTVFLPLALTLEIAANVINLIASKKKGR